MCGSAESGQTSWSHLAQPLRGLGTCAGSLGAPPASGGSAPEPDLGAGQRLQAQASIGLCRCLTLASALLRAPFAKGPRGLERPRSAAPILHPSVSEGRASCMRRSCILLAILLSVIRSSGETAAPPLRGSTPVTMANVSDPPPQHPPSLVQGYPAFGSPVVHAVSRGRQLKCIFSDLDGDLRSPRSHLRRSPSGSAVGSVWRLPAVKPVGVKLQLAVGNLMVVTQGRCATSPKTQSNTGSHRATRARPSPACCAARA